MAAIILFLTDNHYIVKLLLTKINVLSSVIFMQKILLSKNFKY